MATIYTIGFTQKPLSQFIGSLQAAGVDVVVDTRLRNTSQLSGYAKRDDLAFVLKAFHIAYEHHPELAPTAEILDPYRQNHDWVAYIRQFRPLIEQRRIEEVGRDILKRYRAPCLLCSEATAEHCHRRLVAEYWAERIPDLEIVHL
jgi:uncharacterized protein (DUF488 family)